MRITTRAAVRPHDCPPEGISFIINAAAAEAAAAAEQSTFLTHESDHRTTLQQRDPQSVHPSVCLHACMHAAATIQSQSLLPSFSSPLLLSASSLTLTLVLPESTSCTYTSLSLCRRSSAVLPPSFPRSPSDEVFYISRLSSRSFEVKQTKEIDGNDNDAHAWDAGSQMLPVLLPLSLLRRCSRASLASSSSLSVHLMDEEEGDLQSK